MDEKIKNTIINKKKLINIKRLKFNYGSINLARYHFFES